MIDRRSLFAAAGGGAVLAAAQSGVAQAADFVIPINKPPPADARGTDKPVANNPFNARAYIYTIVTPDMEASLHLYRDVLGNDLIEQGVLGGTLPTMAGVGQKGRAYALLSHKDEVYRDRGVIRLLQAPPGAKANRPRPQAQIMDPGLISIECHPSDFKTAFEHLAASGVQLVAPPAYYFGGKPEDPDTFSIMFSCFGAAGEQMFISSHPSQIKTYPGLYGMFQSSTLSCVDRWPLWDFYDQAFGLKPAYDRYVGEEIVNYVPVNNAIGAPKGTYFQFGGMGSGLVMEWWEFRQWRPSERPTWPTQLDQTGIAMTTIQVEDAEVIRARVKAANIPILGEGHLPTPGKVAGGFYIRGGVGELIEVVGRVKA